MLLKRPDGCNQEQFKAFGHRREFGRKVLFVRTDDALTDDRSDRISRHSDGCKGLELHCLEFCIESS
jgi:hypothetical protein